MNTIRLIRLSALAAAVASTLAITAPAFGQTTPPADTPPPVLEDRSLRVKVDDRDLTLATPLDVKDAAGNTVISLPVGTMIGRDRMETRFAAPDQPIRQRTELRDVTLAVATTVTDPRTGNTIELPAGTVIRVKVDVRRDAAGNIVRDRVDLRAVEPDGTKIRIRDRAPEMEVGEIENEVEHQMENEAANNHRQRGRDAAKAEGVSGRDGVRVDMSSRHGGRDRVERPERSGRPDRVDRVERPDRPERSGHGGSGPG